LLHAYGLRRTGTAEGHLEGVVEDTRVEEDQGLHGLVLGSSCDVSMHHPAGQERLDRGGGCVG
jgi:hypothetical protein